MRPRKLGSSYGVFELWEAREYVEMLHTQANRKRVCPLCSCLELGPERFLYNGDKRTEEMHVPSESLAAVEEDGGDGGRGNPSQT